MIDPVILLFKLQLVIWSLLHPSIYAKSSEFGKKQYNYIKDLYKANEHDEDSEIFSRSSSS